MFIKLNTDEPTPRAPQTERIREIKRLVTEVLGLAPGTLIIVNELACAEPGCPDVETVIAVSPAPRQVTTYRVLKPISAVEPDDVRRALTPESAKPTAH